jgi:hypothetical protein
VHYRRHEEVEARRASANGFTLRTRYWPLTRFWAFQWIEGGWLLALLVGLIVVTVVEVQRRAT